MAEERNLLNVSSSPHIRVKADTCYLMKMVVAALAPAAVFGIFNFGPRALLILALSIASACFFEAMMDKILHKPLSIGDFSAVVTGLLLGMNLPVGVPWWMPILGSAFAIIIVKQMFGGLGKNFVNPALAARCFMLIAWTGAMTTVHEPLVDAVSSATPLAIMKDGAAGSLPTLMQCFLGFKSGTIGEVSAIALIVGFAYLLVKRVVSIKIPAAYLLSFALLTFFFVKNAMDAGYLAYQLLNLFFQRSQ